MPIADAGAHPLKLSDANRFSRLSTRRRLPASRDIMGCAEIPTGRDGLYALLAIAYKL